MSCGYVFQQRIQADFTVFFKNSSSFLKGENNTHFDFNLITVIEKITKNRCQGGWSRKSDIKCDISDNGENGVSGGGVNIKDPVPLYIMDWEWGGWSVTLV